MTGKSVFALAAILALGSLSLATDASAEHGGGGRGVAAADTLVVVAVDTLVVAAVAILAAAAVDTSVVAADTLPVDASRLGMGRAAPLWLGVDPDRVYMSRQDIAPTHLSPANTAAISGMAVGGITALARAGYGRTTTVSTYGPAAKDRQCHFIGGLKPPPVPTFLNPGARS